MTQDMMTARKYLENGKIEKALKLLQTLIKKSPENIEALFFYGSAFLQKNDARNACKQFEKALELNPIAVSIQNALGLTLFRLNRIDESESVLRKASKANPDNLEVLGNLGLVLVHTGKHDEALEALQRVVQNGGATPKIMEELGKELMRHELPQKAEQLFARLKQLQPDNHLATVYMGNFLAIKGEVEQAHQLWQQAIKQAPDKAEPHISIAIEYLKNGDMTKGIQSLENALKIDKGNAGAAFLWAYTVDKKVQSGKQGQRILDDVKQALDRDVLEFDDWNNLLFAAGRLSAAQKDFDASFDYYHRANQRIWSRQGIPANLYEKRSDELLKFFDPLFYLKNKKVMVRKPKGDDKCGEGLIFVFGMPRSGTTLVEHIIARNPSVYPGGECAHMESLMNTVDELTDKKSTFPQNINELSLENIRKIAGDHHAVIKKISNGALYFSDKNLQNFMLLGFMAYLFPRAKFINCIRNPVDTCLSSYFSYFALNSLKFTYNLDVLGKVYCQYERLMKTWHKVLPVIIHDVVYEELTENPDTIIRDLVGYCGFQWDDQYLSAQEGNREVFTASVAEVRKPIYKGSVGRWKPYEAHLGPLLKALKITDKKTGQ